MSTRTAHRSDTRRPWASRVAWLVFIWLGSVCALGFVAWLMKTLMRAAGLA